MYWALDVGLACFRDGVSLLVDMEGDSGWGELLVSAVLEKSSPNSCKQTRSSSAIGRQESVSENSIRCAWCRVFPNSTDKLRGAIVGSMGTTNHHRMRFRKPRIVGENRDISSHWKDDEPEKGSGQTNAGI
ncbi:hypothetical protein TNCV_3420741 [Trichonephila clavipes]|nr:hypothetical protein TNCV_3420741 [Trichonephila clavipes]